MNEDQLLPRKLELPGDRKVVQIASRYVLLFPLQIAFLQSYPLESSIFKSLSLFNTTVVCTATSNS